MNERERFEREIRNVDGLKWKASKNVVFERDGDGYTNDLIQFGWLAWQAALKNSKEELYRQAILENWEDGDCPELCIYCREFMPVDKVHKPDCIVVLAQAEEQK